MSDKKKLILKGCVFIFSCLIVFFAGEITLRLFAPSWLQWKMHELNVGSDALQLNSDSNWEVEKKDGEFISFIPFANFTAGHFEYLNSVHIDQWGGRSTASPEKADGSILVPFMGDSMTFGLGVEDYQTYVSLTNEKSKFRYINLGVNGSSLPQQLNIIKHRHRELGSPAVYVFNFCIKNDFSDIVSYHTKPKKGEITREIWIKNKILDLLGCINYPFFKNPILKRSYMFQFIKAILLNFYNQHQIASMQLRDEIFLVMGKNNSEFLSDADKYLDIELEHLLSLAQDLNFKAVFILIPDRVQVYPDILKLKARYYNMKVRELDTELPNRMLRRKLEAHNIPYVDILECMRRKQGNLYYIRDNNHLTVEGNRAAYECIYPDLEAIISGLVNPSVR